MGVGNYCYVASARRRARRLGSHGGGEGRGHIVSPRAQLVLYVVNLIHYHENMYCPFSGTSAFTSVSNFGVISQEFIYIHGLFKYMLLLLYHIIKHSLIVNGKKEA